MTPRLTLLALRERNASCFVVIDYLKRALMSLAKG